MKKINLIMASFLTLLIAGCGAPTNKESEEKSSTEEFADLGEEEGFAEKHDEPKEIEDNFEGNMISIAVEGGDSANVYHLKNQSETNKYLFVIHEWWGLNNHIKREADKWFTELGNVNVMALDLYDGEMATTREKATELMQGADEERIQKIIDAALAQLPSNAKVATVGWCFGGGWSLRTALRAGNKTAACVMYYGMPVKDVERLKTLNSDVLFIYGTQDEWINEEVANNFEENMKAANKEVKIMAFDADHAFANPTGEHYLEDAAMEANQAALEFIKKRM